METKSPKTIKEFVVENLDEDGKVTEAPYLLKQPPSKAVRDSKWRYSVVYNQALKEGLLTERQMTELLKSSEDSDILEEGVSSLTSLYLEAGILQQQLSEEEDFGTKRKLAEKLSDLRQEIFEEEASLRAPYNNTAEQRAEESRLEFLLFHMVYDTDGNKAWETEEDFEQEVDVVLIETAKTYLIYWMNDLPEDWQENLPETKVIREGLKKDLEEAREMAKAAATPKETTPKKKASKKKTTKKPTSKKKTTKKVKTSDSKAESTQASV